MLVRVRKKLPQTPIVNNNAEEDAGETGEESREVTQRTSGETGFGRDYKNSILSLRVCKLVHLSPILLWTWAGFFPYLEESSRRSDVAGLARLGQKRWECFHLTKHSFSRDLFVSLSTWTGALSHQPWKKPGDSTASILERPRGASGSPQLWSLPIQAPELCGGESSPRHRLQVADTPSATDASVNPVNPWARHI